VINSEGLNIKPAYNKSATDTSTNVSKYIPFEIEDKNTIFSAMLKKGQKPPKKSISFNLPS
jgi:hypothetical protein